MKILIDATGIRTEITGVGRYSIEILRELFVQNYNNEITLLLNSSINKDNEIFSIIDENVDIKYLGVKGIGIVREIKFLLFRLLNADKYDVFHSLSSNAPIAFGHKSVVTFHDMKYVLFPKYMGKLSFFKSKYIKFHFFNAINRYTKIITVSKSTLTDLVKIFPEYKDVILNKADIIYNSSRITKKEEVDVNTKYNINGRYFLYIGELRPHKNVDGLIKAYMEFQNKFDDNNICLVIGGKKHSSYLDTFKEIKNLNFIGYVDENDLYSLYKNSIAYCLVSHYEGFGIPIIEAMECNTPVITSNISSMPEIAGDAAILVDPEDSESILNALSKVYLDTSLRDNLILKGSMRIKEFSWKKSAAMVLDVYKDIARKDLNYI